MKKIILLMMMPIALFLSSCEKSVVLPNRTIIVNLASGSWRPLNGGNSYTAAINVPELNDYMNERGGVLVYLSFGEKTYEQIPQVYNGDSYSFITRPGEIVLELQQSGGGGTVLKPGNMTVKIILMDSDY